MAVETTKDPRTKKPITIVSGTVNGVFFNELKTKKDYGTNGKSWVPTHSVVIVVDKDERINLGLTDKDKLRCKDSDDNYQDVVKGVEVSVVVDVGEYNGKPQYSAKATDVIVTNTAGAVVPAGNKGKGEVTPKKDMTRVQVDYAVNGAFSFEGYKASSDTITETAKVVYGITASVREWYANKNPSLCDYDAGAISGYAVLNALSIAKERKKSIDEVEAIAKKILTDIIPAVTSHVKGGGKAPTTVEQEEQQELEQGDFTNNDLSEDDIPF